jgi:hypothetical protein
VEWYAFSINLINLLISNHLFNTLSYFTEGRRLSRRRLTYISTMQTDHICQFIFRYFQMQRDIFIGSVFSRKSIICTYVCMHWTWVRTYIRTKGIFRIKALKNSMDVDDILNNIVPT